MFNKYFNNSIKIAALAVTAFFASNAKAVTVYTSNVATGNWSTSSTWVRTGSGSPVKYTILAGHSITMDANVSSVDTVWVAGTLNMGNNRTLSVNTSGAVILDWGGIIQGGSNNTAFIMIGSSFNVYGPFTSTNIISNGPRWMTANTVNIASGAAQGSFVALLTLLPVELASIDVNAVAGAYELNWTALGESNNSNFTIEVSYDGKNYSQAGVVAGNNEIVTGQYNFNLGNMTASFYVKLSETNANGKTTELAVKYVTVNNKVASTFAVFPTLLNADSDINMVIPAAGNYSVKVYTIDMQVATSTTFTTNSENEAKQIHSSELNLTSGSYIVVVSGDQGAVYKSRIVVR